MLISCKGEDGFLKPCDKNVFRKFECFVWENSLCEAIRYPEYCVDGNIYSDFPVDICIANLSYYSYLGQLKKNKNLNFDLTIRVYESETKILFEKELSKDFLDVPECAIPYDHGKDNCCFDDFSEVYTLDFSKIYPTTCDVSGFVEFEHYSSNRIGNEKQKLSFHYQRIDSFQFFKIL